MAKRPFRTEGSLLAEKEARDAVAPFLRARGFKQIKEERVAHGTAVTQVIEASRGWHSPIRMHVRLCWRRGGRHGRERLYSAAQLRARLTDDDWTATLNDIAAREAADGNTHLLILQPGPVGFELAVLIPADRIPSIWARQRAVSGELIAKGLTGRLRQNHATNGSSPTIWLQDDRTPHTHEVADVLWIWPGVEDLLNPRAEPLVAEPPPIIYFNVGWMVRYAGPAQDDPTIGAHGYLNHHRHGAESSNFLKSKAGTVRGYRPPGNQERTNIRRMGTAASQASISGALVVWLAREPGSGRTLIVGWYRNATVFRDARDGGINLNGERIHYSVEAAAADATLLEPVARTFEVRSSRRSPGAGFGQKPTWYGAKAVDAKVWGYIRSWGSVSSASKSKSKKPPRNLNPELRREVERAAVDHAIAYYRSKHGDTCVIETVENFAKGWDLEIFDRNPPTLVEVKGLFGSDLVCELTPNEYKKMQHASNRDRYVIYVVNNAVPKPPGVPIASIFANAGEGVWRTEDGRKLIIRKRTGAVLTCL